VEYTGGIARGPGGMPIWPSHSKTKQKGTVGGATRRTSLQRRDFRPQLRGRWWQVQAAITFSVGRFVQNPSCSSCCALAMRFRIVFVRTPNSSCGLSYIPEHTATAERGKKGYLGPFQGPWEVGQQPHEVESEQRSFRLQSSVVLGQEMDLDKHNQVRNVI
jgi:hypothetical protein